MVAGLRAEGGSGANASHTYTAAGNYTATVTVSDGQGGAATASVAITATSASLPGWLAGYGYRKTILISNTYVDADLTDFPLLVAFNGDPAIGSHMLDTTTHRDIRFTDSDGTTLLKYEKEYMSIASGLATGRYWVKAPAIRRLPTGSQNTIHVYYGKAGDIDGSDRNNVWDAGYNSVWHFSEGSGNSTYDSKRNMSGTLSGTTLPTWTSSGVITTGLSFGGAGYVRVNGTPPSGNTHYTLEAWIKIADIGNRRGIVGWGNYGSSRQVNAFRCNNEYSGIGLQNYWWGADLLDNDVGLTTNWDHALVKFNGATRQIFFNAGAQMSDTPGSPNFGTANFEIGRTNFGEYWKGTLDEVRISHTARSDAWIKFEYRNMGDAGNGLSYGPEQTPGGN